MKNSKFKSKRFQFTADERDSFILVFNLMQEIYDNTQGMGMDAFLIHSKESDTTINDEDFRTALDSFSQVVDLFDTSNYANGVTLDVTQRKAV